MFNSKPLTVKTSKTARRYELRPSSATAVLPKCHAASPRTAPKNPRGGRGEKGWNFGPTQKKEIPDLDMAIFNVVVGDLEFHQFQNLTFRPQNDTRFEAGDTFFQTITFGISNFRGSQKRLLNLSLGIFWTQRSKWLFSLWPTVWAAKMLVNQCFTLKANVRIAI